MLVFRARPLSSRELLVAYPEPVSASAALASSYALSSSGAVPPIVSAAFSDSDRTSVVLTLGFGMTAGSVYTVSVTSPIVTDLGHPVSPSSNFSATVPDVPIPNGAFLSARGFLDVVFDRPVGPFSPSATASVSADGGGPVAMTVVPWSSLVPASSVRFALGGGFPAGSSYVVSYAGVADASMNPSAGTADLRIPWAGPHTLVSLTTPRISHARVRDRRGDSRTCLVDVLFSCPMDPAVGSATVTAPQSHASPDVVNTVSVAPVTDGVTFHGAMSALRSAYNAHVVQDGVHSPSRPLSDVPSLCLVANDLAVKLSDHVVDGAAHSVPDASLSVAAAAHDIPSALSVLTAAAAAFNLHRVALGVHSADDTLFVAPAPPVSPTLAELCAYADDLKVRVSMHVGTAFHPAVRPGSVPSSDFCYDGMAYGLTAAVHDCAAQLREASFKVTAHMASPAHTYPFAHSSDPPVVDYPDTAGAHSAADGIVARYSEHASASGYSVPVLSQERSQSRGPSDFPSDGASYRVTYSVGNCSPSPHLTVSVTSASLDATPLSDTVDAAASPEAVVSVLQSDGYVAVRHDGLSSVSGVNVVRGSGPRTPALWSSGMSVQAVVHACWDVAEAYSSHVGSAVRHDVHNSLLPALHTPGFVGNPVNLSLFGAGLSEAMRLLNEVATRYMAHVIGGSGHYSPSDGDAILSGVADSVESAASLAEALRSSLRAHNSNSSQHDGPGWESLPDRFTDEVTVRTGQLRDGAAASLFLSRPGLNDGVVALTGRASPPMVSSAEVVPGLDMLRMRLVRDKISVSFSKPMSMSAISPANFTVTGGPVTVTGVAWAGPRAADLFASGTRGIDTYVVSASGLTDEAGNPLV